MCIRDREYRKKDCVILYFIGLTESYEGEGYDRKNLKIPQNQEKLLAEIEMCIRDRYCSQLDISHGLVSLKMECISW